MVHVLDGSESDDSTGSSGSDSESSGHFSDSSGGTSLQRLASRTAVKDRGLLCPLGKSRGFTGLSCNIQWLIGERSEAFSRGPEQDADVLVVGGGPGGEVSDADTTLGGFSHYPAPPPGPGTADMGFDQVGLEAAGTGKKKKSRKKKG